MIFFPSTDSKGKRLPLMSKNIHFEYLLFGCDDTKAFGLFGYFGVVFGPFVARGSARYLQNLWFDLFVCALNCGHVYGLAKAVPYFFPTNSRLKDDKNFGGNVRSEKNSLCFHLHHFFCYQNVIKGRTSISFRFIVIIVIKKIFCIINSVKKMSIISYSGYSSDREQWQM